MFLFNIYLIIAAVWDLVFLKIPNALTLGILPLLLAYRFYIDSWAGLLESIFVVIIVPLILLYPFMQGGIGAGDIKFFVNIGVFMGALDLMDCFVYGVICSIPMIFYLTLRHKERIFYLMQTAEKMPGNEVVFPYIPPFAIGTFIYIVNPDFLTLT